MIHDVDATLRALIERDVLDGPDVELSFEAPTREWAGKLALPTINVFLYDIREDPSRRDVFFEEVRDDNGRVIERRQPPRRLRLAYLLSVWTKRPEDEHRLLSALLGCFLRADVLPAEVLAGSLADLGRPVITQTALVAGGRRAVLRGVGCARRRVAPFDPPRGDRAVRRLAVAAGRATGHRDAADLGRASRCGDGDAAAGASQAGHRARARGRRAGAARRGRSRRRRGRAWSCVPCPRDAGTPMNPERR